MPSPNLAGCSSPDLIRRKPSMRLRFVPILLGLSMLAWPAPSTPLHSGPPKQTAAAPQPSDRPTFVRNVAPLLKTYCVRCHSGKKPRGQLALDIYTDDASAVKDHDVWERVVKNLQSGDMPPPRRPRPDKGRIAALARWVDVRLAKLDCTGQKDPGHVTVRRLNRVEYNNTIRDLVGIDFHPADDFPADDVGYGFDNIGDVLTLPPLLMEKYLAAAEKIVDRAFKDPQARRRILIAGPDAKNPDQAARKVLQRFASRAYRRPLFPPELDRLLTLVHLAQQQGDGFEKGIQLAVEAVLVSPHFLFRIERDFRAPNFRPHHISEYELATRLSYFLWSSMPDDPLFELARKKELRKNLDAQVRRMMADPKVHAFVENFAGQWLDLRSLKTIQPDPQLFPTFDESLRAAMLKETQLFVENVMKEDRSILDFIDSDYSFLNERLARHYGIPGVQGEQFRRVSLTGTERGGVLTQASILTLTSNPTRTSPVKRGKWILENIFNTPPPPPPPEAGRLKEDKQSVLSGSLRQRMEQHRAKPMCASCHARMDPLGFGFENFDAVGHWRTRDSGFSIDPSGVLPSGQAFQGPKGLRAVLRTKEADFRRCLAEKMLTYALGRGLESYDRCAVTEIADAVARDRNRFSGLVLAVVKSEPFQMRRSPGRKK
jgi:hypothetical protein